MNEKPDANPDNLQSRREEPLSEIADTLKPALDTNDVAALFKCNRATVERLIRANRLPAVRVGSRWRIRYEDAVRFLAGELPSQQPPSLATDYDDRAGR